MTTTELLTAMRNVLRYDLDAVKASADMTDAEGVVYLNRAQNEISRMLRIYRTGVSLTAAATTREFSFGSTAFARMPIEIAEIYNGTRMIELVESFPVTLTTATPKLWWVEGETLRFDGYYGSSTTLTLNGYFGEVKMTMGGGSTENTLPELVQPNLAEYAAVIAVRGTATEASQQGRIMSLERGMTSNVRKVKASIKAHQFPSSLLAGKSRYIN
jgi:hypothetical protein